MYLWCDVGNTRIKWQLCNDETIVHQGAIAHKKQFEQIGKLITDELPGENFYDVSFVGVASVQSELNNKTLIMGLKNYFACEIKRASVDESFEGLSCIYQDKQRFGVDRWLAMLAAYSLQKGRAFCVIDAGSALTCDFVLADGEHLGGYIVPGLEMCMNALLGQTDAVRFDRSSHIGLEFGRNTAEAVEHGVLLQSLAMIEASWNRFSSNHFSQNPVLLLTGGDARLLASVMRVNFELYEDLVLQGLKISLSPK